MNIIIFCNFAALLRCVPPSSILVPPLRGLAVRGNKFLQFRALLQVRAPAGVLLRRSIHHINADEPHISTALPPTRSNSILSRSLTSIFTQVRMCYESNIRVWFHRVAAKTSKAFSLKPCLVSSQEVVVVTRQVKLSTLVQAA